MACNNKTDTEERKQNEKKYINRGHFSQSNKQ